MKYGFGKDATEDDVMGVLGDDVLVADPNFGCRAMSTEQFTQIWHGDALIVRPEKAAYIVQKLWRDEPV